MTTAQTQFQKNKDLFEKWTAMAVTDDFQNVLAFARASILEGGITAEQAVGVNLLAEVLLELCDTQEPHAPTPMSRIKHDLSVPRNTGPLTPTPQTSKKP